MAKYRVQGDITIHVDWFDDEFEFDTPEAAIADYKEWSKQEYHLYLSPGELDFALLAEEEENPS